MNHTQLKDINMEALHDVYKELTRLIGFEHMEILYEYYRGKQLNFPYRIYDQHYIRKILREI